MSSNITLYTFGTPNGFKASIVLEELGIPYKAEIIDITKNTQKEDWFLKINPNGRIPALKDGELRVFETIAIMQYLVDKYDKDTTLSFPHGSDEYYELLSWLAFQQGGIGPMQGQANHFIAMAGAKSEYGQKRYLDETKRLYSVLESQLSKTDYLVGNKYTIADIANFSWVRAGWMIEIDLNEFPAVKKWTDRIEAREAVKKGVKVGSSRSPEEMKKAFADMRAKVAAMDNSDKH